ncbi:MAG: cytochrome c [Armatimonadetes bacterium]|nr:cytochrome c [Armatimonadota bacterium]
MEKSSRWLLPLGLVVIAAVFAVTLTPPSGDLLSEAAASSGKKPPGTASGGQARAAAAKRLNTARGKAVYEQRCAVCHSASAKMGPPLDKDVGYFVKAGVPAEVMGGILQQPVRVRPPGSRMPAFTPSELSDADVANIAAYLHSLTPAPKTPLRPGVAARGAKPYARNCAGATARRASR